MTDHKATDQRQNQTDYHRMVELLFFAYRDFTSDADALLDAYGFGRAHHRVLHFVHHYPGMRVAEVLDILQITKQSLSRVLKQLIAQGFIERTEGKKDRRERHLFVTDKGETLATKLKALQEARLGKALDRFTPCEQELVEKFLYEMITTPHQSHIKNLLAL